MDEQHRRGVIVQLALLSRQSDRETRQISLLWDVIRAWLVGRD